MERRLKAELWDKMHYLFRDYNDRMVHVELHYDFEINIDAFKTVLACFFEKAPVFHSSFTDNHISPYWVVKDYNIDDVVEVNDIEEEDLDHKINAFLCQCLPPESDLQMKVLILRHSGKTTVCMIENHMCMDGGDFKSFLKTFCKNYNDYVEKGISPLDLRTGSRSYKSVYKDLSKTDSKAAQNLYKNLSVKDKYAHKFPFKESSDEDYSFIARRRISAEKFPMIKAAGKKRGATINDMLTAAYFYSLYELAGFNPDEPTTISCAIDLRRHMKDVSVTGYTNQTSWMQCRVPELGRDIFETLQYVVRSSNMFKQDKFMGLYGLPLLSLGYRIMPHAASEEIIKIGYSNPLLAMSNIGILEVDKLALEGHEPTDGFMSGAVKYKPFVLLSATSMRNEMTLSMCVRGSDEDKQIVSRFFDLMEKNIDLLIADEMKTD